MSKQTLSFQAEVSQLLHLVTHSLYSNKEIFLRELISNASDACDKLRFNAINQPELYEDQADLAIKISFDSQAKTLTVSDNGIGMTEQEAVDNLGTIAKSGTKSFLDKLSGNQKQDAQLIGQFGVGFYSGFIVADHISVQSRKAGAKADQAVRWSSAGIGEFEVENITKEARGTDVILHLREEALEYLNTWKLKQIINKYAEHISLPILMEQETWQESQEQGQPGTMVKTGQWETVNQANAIWSRNKKDVTEQQYAEFYKQLTYDQQQPLTWAHNKVEGSTEYTQLLYIPSTAPADLWDPKRKSGLKLYVKKVFIMDDAQALIPNYLRFVQGVVDSADLPLNVSRELLQESKDVRTIRDGNTRRILSLIEEMAKDANDQDKSSEQQEKFAKFYTAFGAVLKEGLVEDHSNQNKIANLLRFYSTNDLSEQPKVSFSQYKQRMKPEQEAIYYLTAENLTAAKNSPQLEMFRKKGIEVLLLVDRVDEWALNFFTEFDGTPLQSVAKGAVDLDKLQDEEDKKIVAQANENLKPLIERLKQVLKERTKDVRATIRLVDSPACVVVEQGDISLQMQKLLKQSGQNIAESKPVLEINPQHAIIQKMLTLATEQNNGFDEWASILFDQAILAEGGELDNPAEYVKKVTYLLTKIN